VEVLVLEGALRPVEGIVGVPPRVVWRVASTGSVTSALPDAWKYWYSKARCDRSKASSACHQASSGA